MQVAKNIWQRKGENPMRVDDVVHVDTDNEEWGRVASDGIIMEIFESEALVNVINLRANILVPLTDISDGT
jgi:hypothetical protein